MTHNSMPQSAFTCPGLGRYVPLSSLGGRRFCEGVAGGSSNLAIIDLDVKPDANNIKS
ncbi:hypothetical protein ACFLT5_03540 [Chloroflexota bacterium]